MYDTGGQERFNAINESYYRRADAILLIYDITQRNSFDTIKEYYCPKIKDLCKENIPIILLGNKADLEDKREVTIDEGAGLALERNLKFKETSCLKNENVADAFEALIELWNFENHKKKKKENKEKEKEKGKKKGKEKEKKKERKNSEDFSKSSLNFDKENDDKEETDNKMRSSLCLNYLYDNKEDFNLEKEDNDNKNDFENEKEQRFTLRPSDNLESNKDSNIKKKKKNKCINS